MKSILYQDETDITIGVAIESDKRIEINELRCR
jgi:hypothetical protein